jgi:hypothetical protein
MEEGIMDHMGIMVTVTMVIPNIMVIVDTVDIAITQIVIADVIIIGTLPQGVIDNTLDYTQSRHPQIR